MATWDDNTQEGDKSKGVRHHSVGVNSGDTDSDVLDLNPRAEVTLVGDIVASESLSIELCTDRARTNFVAATLQDGTIKTIDTNSQTLTLAKGFTGLKITGASQAGTSTVDVTQVF